MCTIAFISSVSACRLVGQGHCPHSLSGAIVIAPAVLPGGGSCCPMQPLSLEEQGLYFFTLRLLSGHFVSNEQLVSEPNPKAGTRGNS